MPTKSNVPAKGPTAAMVRAARGDCKEEWESDSGTIFHMSHTRAGMIAYKKAPARTTVEFTNGTILPIDGFGTIKVDLDQPGTTTKLVKMVAVACVPELSRNLLSTRKAVEQWGKPLVYYKTKAVLTCCLPIKQRSNGVNHSSTTKKRLFWDSRERRHPFLTSAPARDCFSQQV